jgi:hypothetical protein
MTFASSGLFIGAAWQSVRATGAVAHGIEEFNFLPGSGSTGHLMASPVDALSAPSPQPASSDSPVVEMQLVANTLTDPTVQHTSPAHTNLGGSVFDMPSSHRDDGASPRHDLQTHTGTPELPIIDFSHDTYQFELPADLDRAPDSLPLSKYNAETGDGTIWNQTVAYAHQLGYDLKESQKRGIVGHVLSLNHKTWASAHDLQPDYEPRMPTQKQMLAWLHQVHAHQTHTANRPIVTLEPPPPPDGDTPPSDTSPPPAAGCKPTPAWYPGAEGNPLADCVWDDEDVRFVIALGGVLAVAHGAQDTIPRGYWIWPDPAAPPPGPPPDQPELLLDDDEDGEDDDPPTWIGPRHGHAVPTIYPSRRRIV